LTELTELKQEFWKDFVTISDYFSLVILPLQSESTVRSQDLFYFLGQFLWEKAAQYGCFFHERFFQGVLSAKLRKKNEVQQEANVEDCTGILCLKYIAPGVRL